MVGSVFALTRYKILCNNMAPTPLSKRTSDEAAAEEDQMSKAAIKERKTSPKSAAKVEAKAPVEEAIVIDAPTEAIGPVCVHRWVIESPNGETSHGRCRHCGAEKEFPNAAEDGLWERNVPQSRWTGRSDWKPQESGY